MLPEKVLSKACYLQKQKDQGKTLLQAHEQFLEGLKQGSTIRYVNF